MKLTPKHKKFIGIGLAILAFIAVLVYLFRDKPVVKNITDKLKPPAPKDGSTTDEAFKIKEAAPTYDDSYPLKVNSRGDRVKTLQQALNRLKPSPLLPLVVDGVFGEKTKQAVISWAGTKYYGTNGITENLFNEIIANSNAPRPAVTYGVGQQLF